MTQLEDDAEGDGIAAELTASDRWILSQLGRCLEETHDSIARYRFDLACKALYEFTWHEFCDWYLELTKPVLNDDSSTDALKRGARQTLSVVLAGVLRALHPLIPFITEELWLALNAKLVRTSATIMHEPYPLAADFNHDAAATAEIEWLKAFIAGIRQIRGEMNLNPGLSLPVSLAGYTPEDAARVERNSKYIRRLARVASVDLIGAGDPEPPGCAVALIGDLRILVQLAGLIDIGAEIERLEKQLGKVARDLETCRKNLSNPKFVDNAPADIVQQERDRVTEFEQKQAGLEAQVEKLRALR